ncbi:MAG: HEAT repeat domain-containing protein [Nitrospiraceae bacterium]|nr:HEAT repeat domain-containing protein [Nitrospiraceae bacterium]
MFVEKETKKRGLMTTLRYCPVCFNEVPQEDRICPFCKVDIPMWSQLIPYTSRLIHALNNPHSEVRMGAILSLGKRGDLEAARPLADCALRWPTDVVQGLEIVRAIDLLPSSPERREALERLILHPSRPIRRAAEETLRGFEPSLRPTKPKL